jgi:hypothetical protein
MSILSSLTLSLRIPYLPWGDSWQDYAMIIRTLHIGYPDFWLDHEPVLKSLISQPLMPSFLAFLTFISGINPLLIQKTLIPLIGASAPFILYKIGRTSIPETAAMTGSILFLISTPYLHWLVQPVRETLAIPVLLLALFLSDAIITKNYRRYVIPAVICLLILPPIHTLTSLIFLISWYGFSLGRIVSNQSIHQKKRRILEYWILFAGSFVYSTLWVELFNRPYMMVITEQLAKISGISQISPPILIFCTLVISIIPYGIIIICQPELNAQSRMYIIFQSYREYTIILLQVIGCIALLGGIIFISGLSSFKISYPGSMILPSLILFGLSLLGLRKICSRHSFHILTWLCALSLFFIVGVIRPSLVEDPLRTLGYLFAPLCLIAGSGVIEIKKHYTQMKTFSSILPLFLALFCTLSLIFTFPAPILLGFNPSPDHPLYDERQYTISHPENEIEGIRWLAQHHENGTIYTDTNIYYATLWITQDGSLKAEKRPDRLNPGQFKTNENSYVLISDRMFTSAKFGEWLLGKARPLSQEEYQQIVTNTTRIYKKEDFEIFLHPAQAR